MQEDHDSLREETKNKNVEELESMKHELLKKIEELDKQFDVEFQTYVQETENRSTKYKELLEKNRIDSDDINQAQNKINGFKEQNSYWTLKRVQNKRDCTLRNEQLAREKKKIVDHYHSLKKKMAYQREDKEKHLGTLSMNALSCMETLHDY